MLLGSFATSSSRSFQKDLRVAVNPQRLALLGESHLEHYSALGILSLETQCAHGFCTPSVDESQT